ncbi:MAG: putative small rane protein [Fibrobacteres bacterium]|nr:putative small rane protein [Fibrobacterota bacterium]
MESTFSGMDWLRIAGGLGFLGVGLGAFGAHALKAKVPPEMLTVWHTGVLYHLIHALVLLALALFAKVSGADIRWGARFFAVGILLFSGSLYAMTLTGIKSLGAITPLGGVAFLLGWGWVVLRLAARP